MGSANPSTKRKQLEKADRLPKRPKVVLEPVVGLKTKVKKTVTKPGPKKGKGLMTGSAPTVEKVPVLLREDSKYALEQLSSIITKPGPKKGKGLMTGSAPTAEKVPVLLREDSKYALEQLSSIITADDYEDLSNHTTEAMAETLLFCITQVTKPIYFLFPFRQLVRLLTLPSSGNVNDEGVDGPLPQP